MGTGEGTEGKVLAKQVKDFKVSVKAIIQLEFN
jgi:hypothetical protein